MFTTFETFDNIFNSFNLDPIFKNSDLIRKTDSGLNVTILVPGHNNESLHLEANGSNLELTSVLEKAHPSAVKIERKWKLTSSDYDLEKVEAEVKDGILTIQLPKKITAPAKSNGIKIK